MEVDMNQMNDDLKELKEKLAAIEHERWADWQKWVHSRAYLDWDAEGNTIYCFKQEQISAWDKQITTPYSELSDREKASDMEQVDRYWPLILNLIKKREAEARMDELEKYRSHRPSLSLVNMPDLNYINDRIKALKSNNARGEGR